MDKEWRPIPGYPGYYASNIGEIGSARKRGHCLGGVVGNRLRILKPGGSEGGYLSVGLCVNGSTTHKSVHTLVMLAFVGEVPVGMEVCHNDGNKRNNSIDNLRYDTHLANVREARRKRRQMENLEEIKTGWMPISEAAKVAGISRQNVYYYINTKPEIRTRYVKARREIRVEDLLKAIGADNE